MPKFGIKITKQEKCGDGTRTTVQWCHNLEGDRILVSDYPNEPWNGLTADKVREVVRARIGDYPHIRAIKVSSVTFT
jgi:hypothetical protein